MRELWVEKYRPRRVEDVILPTKMRDNLKGLVAEGDIPNMILSGPAGTGKTTIARALCSDLDFDFIMVNGSDDRNIDTLRDRVRSYASTVSLTGSKKVIFFDEADYLNPKSTQPALRGFIEEFSDNCRFIFTCNYPSKLIEPLRSRCSVFDFTLSGDDLIECAAAFFARLEMILKAEKVEYEVPALFDLIKTYMPDWRRVINECQRHAGTGPITREALSSLGEASFLELIKTLRAKDFKAMRKWVAGNQAEPVSLFRRLYDSMDDEIKPESRPVLVTTLADYDYRRAFVADQEINTVACLTEIMRDVNFK